MSSEEITFLIECEVRPGLTADFERFIPVLESTANNDTGAVEYRWFVGSSPTSWCLYERYRDSKATLAHMDAFGQEGLTKRYLELVAVKSVLMLGPASDDLVAQLAPFFDGSIPGVTATRYGNVEVPTLD